MPHSNPQHVDPPVNPYLMLRFSCCQMSTNVADIGAFAFTTTAFVDHMRFQIAIKTKFQGQ